MFVLQAESREKGVKAGRIRSEGLIPGCLYGKDLESSRLLQIKERDARNLLKQKTSGNKIVLSIDGVLTKAILREIRNNQIKNRIEHLSFQKLNDNDIFSTAAQITLVNRDKIPAGNLQQPLYEIPYRALASKIVEKVEIDLEGMEPGGSVKVRELDIAKDKDIELLIDPDSIIVAMNKQ